MLCQTVKRGVTPGDDAHGFVFALVFGGGVQNLERELGLAA